MNVFKVFFIILVLVIFSYQTSFALECVPTITQCSDEAQCGVEKDDCGEPIDCDGICDIGLECVGNMCEPDYCDPDFNQTCSITSVTSNEPLNDIGDGNTDGDYLITGDLTVDLRAERAGPLKGRMYTITVECADASGNTATRIATVNARHSKVYGTVSGDIQAGEVMSLYKASCGGDLLVETAIIDSKGQYAFDLPLLRGTYTVAPLNPDYSPDSELIEVIIPQLWFFGPYDLTETD